MINFKIARVTSPKHLMYLRTLPCIVSVDGQYCNGSPVHAHHLTILKGERGVGQKVGDNYTLPVCAIHHRNLHDMGEKKFWEAWGIDAIEEALKLWENNNG